LGEITITGQQLTNLAFGGADFKTLYLITRQGLYKLPMKVKGYKSGQPTISIGKPILTRNAKTQAFGSIYSLDGRQV
jgi:hypothetical protein